MTPETHTPLEIYLKIERAKIRAAIAQGILAHTNYRQFMHPQVEYNNLLTFVKKLADDLEP